MAQTIDQLNVRIGADLGGFNRGISDMQSRLATSGQQIANLGKALTASLTVPIVGFGVASLKASNDFNRGLANTETLIGGNQERIQELKTGVQDLAIATGTSTGVLADGLYEVVSAFGDTNDSLSILETNATLARTGLGTVSDALALTSAVTKAFGDTSDEAVLQVANLSQNVIRLGQTSLPELSRGMQLVAPLASSLGVSMEDLSAVFATATGVTGTASQVGTQFRGVLQSLSNPTEDLARVMSDMGFETGRALAEAGQLDELFIRLNRDSLRTGKSLQSYVASIEGVNLVTALGGNQAENFANRQEDLLDSVGALENAFVSQTSGLGESDFLLAQLTASWDIFKQTVGDIVFPMIIPFLEKATDRLQDFRNLSQEEQEQGVIAGISVASIAPLIFIIGQLVSGVSRLIPLFTTVGGAISGFFTSLQAGTGAFAGITAFFETVAGLGASSVGVFVIIAVAVGTVISAVLTLISIFADFAGFRPELSADTILTLFKIADALGIPREAVENLVIAFNIASNAIRGLVSKFIPPEVLEGMRAIVQEFGRNIVNIFEGSLTFIRDLFQTVFPIIINIFKEFALIIGILASVIGVAVGSLISLIVTGFLDAFNFLVENVAPIFEGFGNSVIGLMKNLANVVLGILRAFRNLMLADFDGLRESLVFIITNIAEFFINGWKAMFNIVNNATDGALGELVESFVGRFKEIFNNVSSFVNRIIGLINKLTGALGSIELPEFLGGGEFGIPEIPTIPSFSGDSDSVPSGSFSRFSSQGSTQQITIELDGERITEVVNNGLGNIVARQ